MKAWYSNERVRERQRPRQRPPARGIRRPAAGPGQGGQGGRGRDGSKRNAQGRERNRGPQRGFTENAPSQRTRRADPARLVAFEVLRAVASEDAYANLVLPARIRHHNLDKRDAGFATELSYGALRGQGTYDAILARCVDRPLDQLDPAILDALRIGAHQLLAMRVPAHAALDQTVGLARAVIGAGPSALINAVLRKVSARHPRGVAGPAAQRRDGRNEKGRHPLRPPGVDCPGAPAVPRGPRASRQRNQRPPRGGQRRTGGQPRGTPRARQPGRGPRRRSHARRTRRRVGALQRRRPRPARVGPRRHHPRPGRRLAARGPRHGRRRSRRQHQQTGSGSRGDGSPAETAERWLDMCAGPGGKAALLGALAREHGATLLANEPAPHRAKLVRQALAAVPHEVWHVRTGDGREVGTEMPESFDRVLVDAPCTGLGALRRRPESRWRRTPKDLTDLGPLQRELLKSALAAVKPGGVVAYVTCSPHPAETTAVVSDVLRKRDDLELLDAGAVLDSVSLRATSTPDTSSPPSSGRMCTGRMPCSWRSSTKRPDQQGILGALEPAPSTGHLSRTTRIFTWPSAVSTRAFSPPTSPTSKPNCEESATPMRSTWTSWTTTSCRTSRWGCRWLRACRRSARCRWMRTS